MYHAARNDQELAASMGREIDRRLAASRVERRAVWTVRGIAAPTPSTLTGAALRASFERGDWRV